MHILYILYYLHVTLTGELRSTLSPQITSRSKPLSNCHPDPFLRGPPLTRMPWCTRKSPLGRIASSPLPALMIKVIFGVGGTLSPSSSSPVFVLTYLLHTTHAAKYGSRAGLGLTLIQYGLIQYGGTFGHGLKGGVDGSPLDGKDALEEAMAQWNTTAGINGDGDGL
ncbi:hypothetical protein NUW54_g14125 [Trametes sanguinea]|uniref:Uncharacterized protein n=1 Tax=Trametes sanguinea TaxID=158606 RepID=A0ACC1MFF1_9APHY|nr:hypothetical protein NUW54_g14125 [Trametes sanguinea]